MEFPAVPENPDEPLSRLPADVLRSCCEKHFSDRWSIHTANTDTLIEMVEEYNKLVDALFSKQESMFNAEIDEALSAIENEEKEQGTAAIV
ncbi:hypothetical protein HDU86_003504 [Geranomyces michiganensis]|nr:hypothetical protein HDU86_003504 [Geranomyces michiganensis]